MFSTKQAARNGVVTIFDMTKPRLETLDHIFPLQELATILIISHWTSPAVATGRTWQSGLRQTPTCCIGD